MKCPSCHYEQPDDRSDCEACGLIFAKWRERHSGTPAPIPVPQGTLEIRGNLITGNFWREFVVRQLVWVLAMLLVIGLIFWHPLSPYGYWFPVLLVLFLSIFRMVFWIPRKIAVLDEEGFTFAEPWSWIFLIPRWHRALWKDVERVTAGPRMAFQKTDHAYRILVEVRLSESGELKPFEIAASNKNYLDFVRYVAAKVAEDRIDSSILALLEPKSLEQLEEAKRRGARVANFIFIPILILGFWWRMDRWQKSLGDYFWVVLVGFVIVFVLVLYRFHKALKETTGPKNF